MDKNKPQYSKILVLLIAICVAAAVSSLYSHGALERFEFLTMDYRFITARLPSILFLQNLKPPREMPKRGVILIDMPEAEGSAPAGAGLKDYVIAAKILTIWGAREIVFTDLLPEAAGGASDAELVETAMESKGMYLPALYDAANNDGTEKYTGKPAKRAREPWQVLLSSTVGLGHINAYPYLDDRLRRVPVFMEYKGRRIYQLGMRAAMAAMGVAESDVKFDPEAHTLTMKTPLDGNMTVPLEEDNQLTIKWKMRDGRSFRRIPFRDILESYRLIQYGARPIIDPNIFGGNICILGTAASNAMPARPPVIKDGRATSAACGLVAGSFLTEDFVRAMPKALNIALISMIILLFGAALADFHFLRFMMITVVASTLFGLAPVFHISQDVVMIIVIILSVPLGIFIASSQVFSGLIFAILSVTGYYMFAAVLFNTSGLAVPVFFPIMGMISTFILFYSYTRFKHYLGKTRLFNIASKDGLTGLTNRRYLNMLLDSELSSMALDKSRKLSIVMCDIDNFKKLNDTHGHQAGDAILKTFAGIMKSKCRKWDIVARYGGEEFVIILPGAGAKDAMIVAEGIRKAIAEESFVFKRQTYSTSMSMGLAEYSNEKTKEELIEKADQALYRAKNEGKNRVSG